MEGEKPSASKSNYPTVRVAPDLHLIMKGFKEALEVRSVEAVCEMAVVEFIISHSELAEQVQGNLTDEQQLISDAMARLTDLHRSEN